MISDDSSAGKYSCGTPIRRPERVDFNDASLSEILACTWSRTLGGAAVGSRESYEKMISIVVEERQI